jgi:hypothetical protein
MYEFTPSPIHRRYFTVGEVMPGNAKVAIGEMLSSIVGS